jgi:hypothetical protein
MGMGYYTGKKEDNTYTRALKWLLSNAVTFNVTKGRFHEAVEKDKYDTRGTRDPRTTVSINIMRTAKHGEYFYYEAKRGAVNENLSGLANSFGFAFRDELLDLTPGDGFQAIWRRNNGSKWLVSGYLSAPGLKDEPDAGLLKIKQFEEIPEEYYSWDNFEE